VESILGDFETLFQRQAIDFYPRLFRPADYIERSLQNLSGHLMIGGLLVVAVLYLFLFNLRTALIPAVAIPLSLLAAVIALLTLDVHLNIMVLGGLAIALGEVVDDAIIDTENIFRRLRENRGAAQPLSPLRVVFDASMEVRSSVVFASFIVALVFLPLATLGGVAGRLFAPLGYAYIMAILMSLLVALTITPALCYLLLARRKHFDTTTATSLRHDTPLIRVLQCLYSRVLGAIMGWPKLAVTLSLVACAVAFLQIARLGGEFLPELREGHYIVHTASLPGTSLQESMRIGGQLVQAFQSVPGVVSVSQWAGRAERGADTYGSHYSEYEVRLNSLSGPEQARVLDRLREILGRYPGILFEANTFLTERVEETISGYTAPVVINLYGQDLAQLDEKATEVAEMLQTLPGATDIQVRSPPGTPLVHVQLDIESLASVGLRPLEAAGIIQTALQGRVVGHYYLENRAYEVSVILPPEARQQIDTLEKLPLKTPDGLIVELGQIARIVQMDGRYNILHRGGQRVQTVTTHVIARDLQSFLEEVRRRMLNELNLPADITPEFTGAAVEQGAARQALLLHALIAGVGVLLLIYLAIGSLRHVLLILLNLPFSLAGGAAAALLTGSTLSVGSMVGFVTLFGITVRNAIMLISHYRHLTEAEQRPWNIDTALLGAQQRLPSILMTALVTALALLPIAINSDNPGREIMGPMASVIIGGLVSSTVLTLLLLPTVFAKYGRFRSE
jgi:CzcA family heavy metal efflux pump